MPTLTGKELGGCQILEQLGRGGLADVYRAYQPKDDRFVAVKVFMAELFQVTANYERLEQRMQMLVTLRHPNIVPVLEYGREAGLFYMVMELVSATTLAQQLEQAAGQSLPLSTAVSMAAQVAAALDGFHSAGIVHGNIKPSNILIGNDGQTRLSEHGTIHLFEESSTFSAGAFLTTPEYVSPEHSQRTRLDHRSDIYSLGVIFYEMVTGRPPFTAYTPMAVLLKHINEPLPSPRQFNSTLPERFERLLFKALSKNPDRRYQTAPEMAGAIADLAGLAAEHDTAQQVASSSRETKQRSDQPHIVADTVIIASQAEIQHGDRIAVDRIEHSSDVAIGRDNISPANSRLKIIPSQEETIMAEKPQPDISGNINVGHISNATGVAIGHGAQATVTQGGASAEEIAKAFAAITQKVSAMPEGPSKTIAQQAVQGLEAEAKKGEKADEKAVGDWFNFLAQTASDAFDVAVATFANPVAGLGLAFKKVAERAKEEKARKDAEAKK